MPQERDKKPDVPPVSADGGGHLVQNILKILFLITVLAGFWYGFDRWLSGK